MTNVKISIIAAMLLTVFCRFAAAEALKDPTQPPNYQQKPGVSVGTNAAPTWVLSTTLIAPGRRLATINGQTVAVGDSIGGARVESIEASRVVLQKGNQDIVLDLLPLDFKRMH